jgi:hypothetical protein
MPLSPQLGPREVMAQARVVVRKYQGPQHPFLKEYSPDQARDDLGRWVDTSGGRDKGFPVPRGPSEARWANARGGTQDYRGWVKGHARESLEHFLNLRDVGWSSPYPNQIIQQVARGDVVMETRSESYPDPRDETKTLTDEYQVAVDTATGKEVELVAGYYYEEADVDVAKMDALFQRPEAQLRSDAVVYRGIDAKMVADLGSGDRITDMGYTSVGLGPGNAVSVMSGGMGSSQYGLEIFVPKGTPMIVNDKDWEYQEAVLPRGTTLRIIDEYVGDPAGWPSTDQFKGLAGGGFKGYIRAMVVPK